jgi:hypothetical protein
MSGFLSTSQAGVVAGVQSQALAGLSDGGLADDALVAIFGASGDLTA